MSNNTQSNNPEVKATHPAATIVTAPMSGARSDESAEKQNAMVSAEIKKSWSKLSDDDIKLYATQPDSFFTKLKEKQGINREDAQKRLAEIKSSCGCGSAKAA
jgi:galactose-1-phosphate uridylyltransferase